MKRKTGGKRKEKIKEKRKSDRRIKEAKSIYIGEKKRIINSILFII